MPSFNVCFPQICGNLSLITKSTLTDSFISDGFIELRKNELFNLVTRVTSVTSVTRLWRTLRFGAHHSIIF